MMNRITGNKTTNMCSSLQILRIFRRMKRSPQKIFLAKDFKTYLLTKKTIVKSALNTLVNLGVIEKLPCTYKNMKGVQHSDCRGYRLK